MKGLKFFRRSYYFLSVLFVLLTHQGNATEETTCLDDGSSSSSTGTCRSSYTVLGAPTEYTESTTGVKLAVRRWLPPNSKDIKSVILFVHGGAGWHSGYSDIMGRSMATIKQTGGLAVVAFDTIGSGYSEGMSGGLRNYFDSMDTLVDDVSMMLQKVREEYPGKKVFLMGESFGGMILVTQILREQKQNKNALADGYIFTGPVIKVLPEMLPPKPVIAILNFLARFFPMLTMPGTDFFSTFDLAFGDKGWAAAGRADPFIQEAAQIPPRLGMAASLLTNMNNINEKLQDVEVPFKIFMGENEGRVDVDAVKRLAQVAKSTDKEIEIVKGGYHQLFQDVPEVTEKVCSNIQTWVLARS